MLYYCLCVLSLLCRVSCVMIYVMVQNLIPRGRIILVVVVIVSCVAVVVGPDHPLAAVFPGFARVLYHRYEVVQGKSLVFVFVRLHVAESVSGLRVADD